MRKINIRLKSACTLGFWRVFTQFLHPDISFLQHFSGATDTLLGTGNFLHLENDMDWMDGMAAAAIALFWLVTWGLVAGCVKLGEPQ